MPGKIVLLPEDLTNKIAAGEVIERPASIIKELLENSLDAGATEISVVLDEGGCGGIQLKDNGTGIVPAEVPLAFCRFATSKIYEFDDLYQVRSYGFRGEALPSIASIARVEMLTRPAGAIAGTKIVVQNGQVEEISEVGCPPGTQLKISEIFSNVPVRKKFLKSRNAEQKLCLEAVSRLVLPHNSLRIKVETAGKALLSLPATRNLTERIALLVDHDLPDKLIPIDKTQGDISLKGYITQPSFSRTNSKQIQFYVNNRFVRDHLLQHAVMTACRHLIDQKRYPLAYLFLEIPPPQVDVNVHPAKLEVRFRHPQDIYHLVVTALGMAMAGQALSPTARRPFEPDQKPFSDYDVRVREAIRRYNVSTGRDKTVFYPRLSPKTGEPDSPAGPDPGLFPEAEPAPPGRLKFADLEYLGQHGASYLVFSAPGGLVILDQHAAHERIIFEDLKQKRPSKTDGAGQILLLPEVVSLSPADFSLFLEIKDFLAETGLEIEPFGNDMVVIRSLPLFLKGEDPRRIILDILDDLPELKSNKALEEKRERVLIALACRKSFTARERLTPAEAADLCRILDDTPNGYTCPHGRPVSVMLSANDLDRMFKRR